MKKEYNMEEQRIGFKTAKLAKKIGFTYKAPFGDSLNYYDKEGTRYGIRQYDFPHNDKVIDCTQSLLQKWIREEKNILIEVIFSDRLSRKLYEAANKKPSLNFYWSIHTSIKDPEHFFEKFWSDKTFETYEEALEEGLQKALKILMS